MTNFRSVTVTIIKNTVNCIYLTNGDSRAKLDTHFSGTQTLTANNIELEDLLKSDRHVPIRIINIS